LNTATSADAELAVTMVVIAAAIVLVTTVSTEVMIKR